MGDGVPYSHPCEGGGGRSGVAEDGKPLDYVDEAGTQWVMCACGHRAGGGVEAGQRITLCPNCQLLVRFRPVTVVYPERLSGDQIVDRREWAIRAITTTSAEYARSYIREADVGILEEALRRIEGRGFSKTLRNMIESRLRRLRREEAKR